MKKISVRQVLKRYSGLSFGDKLHVFLRLKSMPWKSLLEEFPLGGKKLIDIGCGHGLLINLLEITGRRYETMTGVDPAGNKIEKAKHSIAGNNIRFYSKNIFDVNETTDVCSLIDVLYLIPFSVQEKLLRHVHDILPENGCLILKEVDKKPLWKFVILMLQETVMVKILRLTRGSRFYFRTEPEYRELLSRTGFNVKVKKMRGYIYPHILYICQKALKDDTAA